MISSSATYNDRLLPRDVQWSLPPRDVPWQSPASRCIMIISRLAMYNDGSPRDDHDCVSIDIPFGSRVLPPSSCPHHLGSAGLSGRTWPHFPSFQKISSPLVAVFIEVYDSLCLFNLTSLSLGSRLTHGTLQLSTRDSSMSRSWSKSRQCKSPLSVPPGSVSRDQIKHRYRICQFQSCSRWEIILILLCVFTQPSEMLIRNWQTL